MTREEIVSKLTVIFHEVFNDNTIVLNDGMTANDVDSWDSLTHMLLITKIEEVFAFKFKLKELNKLNNVKGIIETIESKTN